MMSAKRRSAWELVCFGLIGATLGGAPALAQDVARDIAPAPQAPDEASAALHDELLAVREELGIPALAAAGVALFDEGPGTVAAAAVGSRSAAADAPVTIDDRFHLGSLTKSMTATMLARLVERGDLGWETTLALAMPELSDRLPESHRGVSIEHLLTHRSGLPDDRQAGELLARAWRLEGTLAERRRQYVVLAFGQPDLRSPGAERIYSNSGYVVAGVVAETRTGLAWEDLMRRELFEPLGLSTAGFGPPRGDDGRITQPIGHLAQLGAYVPTPPMGGLVADNPDIWGPAGTVHMSIVDLATYAGEHLAGHAGNGRLLGEPTYARLHTPPTGSNYAFGWGVRARDGRPVSLGHAGSNGRWYAIIRLDLRRGVAAVSATNAASDAAQQACDRAAGLALAHAVKAAGL